MRGRVGCVATISPSYRILMQFLPVARELK